jgi:HSP20 family protein
MFVVPLSYALPHRAFHPAWSRPVHRSAEAAPLRPAMDATENDQAYTLTFDLPGMAREQVQVSIEGRSVSVEATGAEAAAAEGARVLRRERQAARFARRIELTSEVNAEASTARFDNGVLTLTLVKLQPSGVRKIEVR